MRLKLGKKLSWLLLGCALHAYASEPTLAELKAELNALTKQVNALERKQVQSRLSSVKTSPVVGLRSKMDGSDLLINLPSMNEDVRLLAQRRTYEDHHGADPFRPTLRLSGSLTGQSYWQKTQGDDKTSIDLTGFSVTLFSLVNPWVQAVGTINYDNDPFDDENGFRISNSRLYLKRAFITVGNLRKSGFYGSLGQMYLPFGRYSSAALTSPFTQMLGRVSARNLVVGYMAAKDDYKFLISGFLGGADASTVPEKDQINEGGVNALVSWLGKDRGIVLGAGWLYNMGAANGVIGALGVDNHAQGKVVHAMDAHTELSVDNYYLNLEYVSALSSFADGDSAAIEITGQRPSAFHSEIGIRPHTKRPSSLAVDYNVSWSAENLLPRSSLGLIASQVIWRDTVASAEYRHNHLYAGDSTHADNRFLAKIGVYF